MEKFKMQSPNQTDNNIARIRELFPNCITEARDEQGAVRHVVDFDQLRQELSDHIVEGPQERYQLNWPGKREALVTANVPTKKTLLPKRQESLHFDSTHNLFIEGDNLEVLKLLQEIYLGQVKMIYIDPPYNTGNDFIYKDDFSASAAEYGRISGQTSESGERLIANPEANGRFHSNWLSMVYPRLVLAKRFLKREGAIFVSCDEGEHPRLRQLMDELFGQVNFVADLVWAAGKKNDSRLVSVSHEYIVCYARDLEYLREKQIVWRQRKKGLDEIYAEFDRLKRIHGDDYEAMTAGMKAWYKSLPDGHPSKAHKHYSQVDFRGLYFPDNISWPGGGGPKYEVRHPSTGAPVKVPSRGWMTSDPKKMEDWIRDKRVHFGDDETTVPCIKSYLKDREKQTPYSVFYQDGRAASKRLRTLMDGDLFDFPKDESVLQEIVEMMTDGEDIILDFFAGSSTTAHAVMAQNAADGGNRPFVMVQLDEVTAEGSAARDAGYETIADVSRERIRRAGAGLVDGDVHSGWKKDIGFRTLKVGPSNFADVLRSPGALNQSDLLGAVENSVPGGGGPEALLFEVLVSWGVDITLPIHKEVIEGKEVFFVNAEPYDLIACFEGEITESFVKRLATFKPIRVVFRDNCFATDAVKINVDQIFAQLSPTTDIKSV